MLLPIVLYPDPRLKLKSKPVTEFGPELKELAADMTETMRNANGVGRHSNWGSHSDDGHGRTLRPGRQG